MDGRDRSDLPAGGLARARLRMRGGRNGSSSHQLLRPYLGRRKERIGKRRHHTLVCKLDPAHVKQEKCTYLDSVVAPTCETGGYTEHLCATCGYSVQDTETEKLGHDYSLVAADAEHPGQHILTCSHDPSHTKTEECDFEVHTVEPGCETYGYTAHTCTKCSYLKETDKKDPIGHKWGGWERLGATNNHIKRCQNDPNHTTVEPCEFESTVTKPTCYADGYTTYTCKDCQNTYTDDTVTSPGHQFKPVEHSKGTEREGSMHEQVCTECEHVVKTPCNFAANTVTKLTCTVDGVVRYTCLDCNYQYDVTTTHPDHLWSAYLSDDAGHHTRKCTREECTETQTATCEFNEQHFPATCTEDAYTLRTCKVETCGYQLREEGAETATGHDWESEKAQFSVKEERSHEITCGNGCGETIVLTCVLDQGVVTEPTCTAKGFTTYTCEKCKAQYKENETEMKPHQYGAWQPVDGYSAQNAKHEHFCSECHDREEETCTAFSSLTTDPTCYAEGKTVTTCESCRGEQTVVLQKTEHTWGSYVIDGANGHYRVCQVAECGEQEETQRHVLKDGKTLPTCKDKGSNYQLCECGYVEDADGEDIPALGHDYKDQPFVYDKDTPGHHYRECKTCHHKDITACVISTVTKDATCMTPDVKTHTCTECHNVTTEEGEALGCEYVYTDNHDGTHDRACIRGDACDNTQTAQKGMKCDYKSVDTKATCTEDAYTTKTCLECSHQEVVTKPKTATGHSYGNVYTSKKDGTHTRKCSNCSAISLEDCEYDSGRVTAPKCTAQGYTTYTCNKCNYAKKENYTAEKGHTWSSTYTPNQSGKHYRTCTVCRATETPTACQYNQTKSAATCTTEPYTRYECRLCNYVRTETTGQKLEHQWKVQTPATEQSHGRSHQMICTACSATKSELCSEILEKTPASCTAPERHVHTCRVCESVYEHYEGEKLEHSWNITPISLSNRHTKTCSSCGETTTEACTGVVTRVQQPTCTESGWTDYTCTKCKGTYTGDPTAPKGHSHLYKLWYQSVNGESHYRQCPDCLETETKDCVYITLRRVEPTCDKSGTAYMECAQCHRTKTERLSPLGHKYPDEWIKSTDGKQHYRLCERPGCEYRNTRSCVLVPINQSEVYCNAPGMEGLTCKDCGYMNSAAINPKEHAWGQWQNDGNGNHYRTCTRMGCNTTQQGQCTILETRTELDCTTPESTTYHCETCGYTKTEITKEARGHDWVLSLKNETSHQGQCQICQAQASGEHDFEDSNLCSVCKYDGLNYTTNESNTYCIVENDNRVSGAEHIVVPATHAVSSNLVLPVKAIGEFAFVTNKNIRTIELPRSITVIMDNAFSGCNNLTSVTYTAGEEDIATEELSYAAFGQCRKLADFPFGDLVKLERIGDSCFLDCNALNEIGITDTVDHIGKNAFNNTGKYKLWEQGSQDALFLGKHLIRLRTTYSALDGAYTLPETTLSVGANAFENCKELRSLTLYNNVKIFESDAFKGCDSLTKLVFNGTFEEWLSIQFKNDLASPLHFVSDFNITGVLDDPTIPNDGSVNAIPAGTFRNNLSLTKITIPEKITSIGARAFEGCANLATIDLPDTVTYIGEDAFKGCTKLEEIKENHDDNGGFYIGHHLISVDNDKVPEDGDFVVRNDTVTISPRAFRGCVKVKKVNIPQSVKWIGADAFTECQDLGEVTFEGDDPVFFATNRQGAGRWLDDGYIQGSTGALNLKYYYPYEWKRIK